MNKKILYIVFSFFLLLTLYEIKKTYGLFESNNKMSVEQSTAKWNILINGTNIKSEEKFVVNSVNVENNENVLNGKIAPGVKGYFDIEIDKTNTSTSIVYSITFDFTKISDSITIENIEETTSGNLIRTGENTYSKVMKINDDPISNIRVYIKWENKEENNDIDSLVGLSKDNYINIPVSISAMQYLGEDIMEYKENGE